MKRSCFGWSSLLFILVLCMAVSPGYAAEPRSGGTLRFATIGEPPSLDIQVVASDLVSTIAQHVFETLFTFDQSYDVVPLLAEDYTLTEDGTLYTIKLRQGVTFHNGKEMTSDDVVASLNRWKDVSSRGKIAGGYITSITAPDKYTVCLKLKSPFSPLLSFLAFQNTAAAIYPKEIAEGAGVNPINEYIGTGPYMFKEWKPDVYIKIVKYPDYVARTEPANGFGGNRTGYLDEIRFIPVSEVATRIAGVQSGEYDFADQISTDQYDLLKDDKRVQCIIVKPYGFGELIFNKAKGLMSDVRLRQAALAALDMTPIMQAAFGAEEFYDIEGSFYPEDTIWYSTAGTGDYNQRNIDKAKKLMEEAGYAGEPFRVLTSMQYDYLYKMSLVAADQWEKVGFNVELQVVDWATLVQRRANPDQYEVFVTSHGFVPDPSLITFLSSEYAGWWVDEVKEEALNEFNSADVESRTAAWGKVQELIYSQVPAIKTGDFFNLSIANNNFQGYVPSVWPALWRVWLDR
jgi:peptide/nickel transport system substrate-binding protein